MSHAAGTSTTYEVRVAGHLDDHWSTWLEDLTLVRHDDGTTLLTGTHADQSQLHGLLARIRDLGAPLLSLTTVDSPAGGAETPDRPHHAFAGLVSTERLTLRPATGGDAEATWTYRRLPSVARWSALLAEDLETYRSAFAEPERLATTVIVERDGHVVGDLMLRLEDAPAQAEVAVRARYAQAEIGWVLDPDRTGHECATEAVRALLTYCFTRHSVHRVVASCFLADETSWQLMECLGMRREGHAAGGSLHRTGQWLDTVTYAVLATEWQPG
jgi:RimJ/RimL family protein N-acetyltransferase